MDTKNKIFGNLGIVAVALSLFSVSNVSFAEVVTTTENQTVTEITDTLPSKNESWYMYWGLGWSRPNYSGSVGDHVSEARSDSSVSNLGLNLDLLGFYWPTNQHQTLLGFVFNAVGDRYSKGDTYHQINQYTFSFSSMHFFGQNIGHGLFLRGDAGLSRYITMGTGADTTSSSFGIGGLAGIGYAFPLSRGNRLLVSANYAYRTAAFSDLVADENLKTQTLSITTGLLF